MFATGMVLLIVFVTLALSRPLIIRTRAGGLLLGVAIGCMLSSLIVAAWRWLP
jgi:accessory gene regulator protein AgrB